MNTISTDFSSYDVILVGLADPYIPSWTDWEDDPSSVAVLKNSGKPILGLGDVGGYDFFGALDLWIGSWVLLMTRLRAFGL